MTFPTLLALLQLAAPIQAPAPAKPAPPSIEEIIARSLQTHPEVLAAEAKLAGAKADLELVKLTLSQRILKAKNRLDAALVAVGLAEQELAQNRALAKSNAISLQEVAVVQGKVGLAKAQLAEAEAEWKVYTPTLKPPYDPSAPWGVRYAPEGASAPAAAAPPTQAELDRYAFLNRVTALKKADKLDLVEAVKVLKEHPNLKGVTLRVPAWASRAVLQNPPLVAFAETDTTVAGWLQSIADDFNTQSNTTGEIVPDGKTGTYDWYVREYGLVFERVQDKPVGAPTLAEFLKAMRSAPLGNPSK